MNKEELRKEFLIIRKNIQNKQEKSKSIHNKMMTLDEYKKSNAIAVYCSLPNEVDTYGFIQETLKLGKKVVVPKIIEDNVMEFYQINSLNDLVETSTFGIKEPRKIESNIVPKNKIDLAIIPGICFDEKRNRIGFGKGFYDRYLEKSLQIYKVGICFEEQVSKEIINSDRYDIVMDVVVTDKRKI